MLKQLILILAATAAIDARISVLKTDINGHPIKRITVGSTAVKSDVSPKVMGGQPAKLGQFPYFASLQYVEENVHFCGASILSLNYLLSSAVCVFAENPSDLVAKIATVNLNDGYTIPIESYVMHPDFDFFKLYNDVSVIKLAESIIQYYSNLQPIQLPIDILLYPGETVTALGGGGTALNSAKADDDLLYYLNSRIMFNEDCMEAVNETINNNELCIDTGVGQGLCMGDAGSPLEYVSSDKRTYIVGIHSFGWGRCGEGFPSGYARVSLFVSWIANQTNLL